MIVVVVLSHVGSPPKIPVPLCVDVLTRFEKNMIYMDLLLTLLMVDNIISCKWSNGLI